MGRRGKNPLLKNLLITEVAAEGNAITKYNDIVIFVQGVVPGDVVDIQITRKRRNYMEGFVTQIHEYSKDRVAPFCHHFEDCGGCKWQMLPYEKQLFYKQKQVTDNFQRLGKFDFPRDFNILGSEKTVFYRNKLEYSFSNKRWLSKHEIDKDETFSFNACGFHVSGRYDKILDIDECHLQESPSNEIRNEIKKYSLENNFEFYDIKGHTGFIRSLIIRTASTGEKMIIVAFNHDDEKAISSLLNHVKQKFPELTSIMYVINPKVNDTINDLEILTFSGNDHIFERMEDLQFKIGPKSFYQTNSHQAYELYKITREFAGITPDDVVYDLYTGTGTIANFVAKKAKKVIGIEFIPEAIEDAKANSTLNSISNTLFFAGDTKAILNQEFIKTHGSPDIIITDPPRAGMDITVVETLLYAAPKRIVYVSCNPATQARDIALMNHQYKVTRVQPVDMFPHTHHVENVVLLEKI